MNRKLSLDASTPACKQILNELQGVFQKQVCECVCEYLYHLCSKGARASGPSASFVDVLSPHQLISACLQLKRRQHNAVAAAAELPTADAIVTLHVAEVRESRLEVLAHSMLTQRERRAWNRLMPPHTHTHTHTPFQLCLLCSTVVNILSVLHQLLE